MNTKDNNVMEKYKKHELFKNIWLGILAFFIGFFVSQYINQNNINTNFLKNDLTNSLQIASSSVISKDSLKQEKKDLSLERVDRDNLKLDLNKNLDSAEKITFNLVFETNKIDILEIKSLNKNLEVIEVNTKNWLKIISIKKIWNEDFWKDILNIKIKKKFETWDDFSFINISSANYLKNWKIYPITSSWINVF
jgi:hypothetical protein